MAMKNLNLSLNLLQIIRNSMLHQLMNHGFVTAFLNGRRLENLRFRMTLKQNSFLHLSGQPVPESGGQKNLQILLKNYFRIILQSRLLYGIRAVEKVRNLILLHVSSIAAIQEAKSAFMHRMLTC